MFLNLSDPAYLAPYQKAAMDSILDFANFYHVRRAFSGFLGNIGEFADMIVKVQMFPDATLLGSFLE
jgi:alpha-amylase